MSLLHLPTHYWTIADLQSAYRNFAASPLEATEACLKRIQALEPMLNAFLHVDGPGAKRHAGSGWTAQRPLSGVPYSLKDNMDVAGLVTTCHSRPRAQSVATRDSEVQRLLATQGAVFLGKNSLHELATGGPSFDLAWPPARNPWDSSRHPGGSSSGSAVAVAAGMAYFSLGTDTSGSVRHPATACGIYGFKPSYGAVSAEGIVPLSPGFDHVGPLTRGARDLAIVMSVLATDHTSGAQWAGLAQAGSVRPLSSYRVGVIDAFSTNLDPDPHIGKAFDAAISHLRLAGCAIERLHVDTLATYTHCARTLSSAQAYRLHGAQIDASPELFGQRTRDRFSNGRRVSPEDYDRMLGEQQRLSTELSNELERVDVAVSLSSLHDPCAIDDVGEIARTYDRQARTPFNLTGMPALSVPTGMSSTGMPLALHIAAGFNRDTTLIEFAMALEKAGLCGFVPQISTM